MGIALLAEEELAAIEAIVGTPVESVVPMWRRAHVLRAQLRDGSSVIVKRPREGESGRSAFETELGHLAWLNRMPNRVVPELLGADRSLRLLVMEDLPPGRSLADSLLTGDRSTALDDLEHVAMTIGELHAWSRENAPRDAAAPAWASTTRAGIVPLLDFLDSNGIAVDGVESECQAVAEAVADGGQWRGFVHGDLCPDNTRITADRVTLFDFERSGWGLMLLDASYFVAPFPTCWCFGSIPESVSSRCLEAYRSQLADDGEFEDGMTDALAAWVVARGATLAHRALEDSEWGTTTVRPRLRAWIRSFVRQSEKTGCRPALQEAAARLDALLTWEWPSAAVPQYPPFAVPGSAVASPPEWWIPNP